MVPLFPPTIAETEANGPLEDLCSSCFAASAVAAAAVAAATCAAVSYAASAAAAAVVAAAVPAKCRFSSEVILHKWPNSKEAVMLVGAFRPEQPLCQVRIGKYLKAR